ncbi:endonuclease NucS [Halovivax sp.]|uniref:endonuclease NucS n=1 Tax=Halovivax sp. TaxID=1935978 RepID=UPI0025BAF4B0|nr:endonuclease NucS [Halovivax sp.]
MTAADPDERVRTIARPSLAAARDAVADALERGAVVTVVGRCTVEYEGRATSSLGPGDRHLMVKPDGTVMVHTAAGRQPVNWQPPGCTCAVERVVEAPAGSDAGEAVAERDAGEEVAESDDGEEVAESDDGEEVAESDDGEGVAESDDGDDGHLLVRSTRSTPAEELLVAFERVLQVSAFDLADEESLSLSGTHEDLKDRILDEPGLVEPGFTPLVTERETAAGAVDVYGEDVDGRAVVLELKRSRAGPDAVGQLERYVDALDRDLHADASVRGILVAPSATDRARRMLAERGLEFVALEPGGDRGG